MQENVKGPDEIRARLTEMVSNHQSALLRLCTLWLKDADLARDAVQETFVKAYKALPSFKGECEDRTWLTRIAVNVCKDMTRSSWLKHIDRSASIDNLPEPSVPFDAPSDRLINTVLQLPVRLRVPVLLYYYHDMGLEETAATLNVSASTVSRRLKAAERKLRAALEEE